MLIILDRDGVINYDSFEYVKSPEEWLPIPGSLEAIAKFNELGHKVVVATNQSGIARGLFNLEILKKIHEKMKQELFKQGGHLDGIFYCPHHPEDNCKCRKPKPGLLLQIANHFQTDLNEAIMIGDSLRDIEAAQAANCQAILVKTGKGKMTLQEIEKKEGFLNLPIFENLLQVAETW